MLLIDGEVARKDESKKNLTTLFARMVSYEYLPVSVEFSWGDTWDNYEGQIEGLMIYYP